VNAPFDWITPELALGGCFDPHPAQRLRDLGVGAVIDLRAETCDDARALAACGVAFLSLPTPDLAAITPAMLDAGVRFAETALRQDRPLLIHCQHGIGRSALLALCVMVDRGWTPAAALRRMKDAREKVSPSPAQYQAWADWLAARKVQGIPVFDAFAAVAYRHLQRA
jgi:predicted protein tyrosine phosphatase